MAKAKCPKCDSDSFRMVDLEVKDADRKHKAIICSACACIVSVEEKHSVFKLVQEIAKKHGIAVPF